MILKRRVLALCLLLLPVGANAQQIAPNPQAVAIATQSYAALTGGAPLHDVTYSGTETRIAGSSNTTESVTLKALGTDNARIDRSQSNTSEIRSGGLGLPAGIWTTSDGASHQMSLHNCLTDAAWFFPGFLSAFGTSQGIQLTYIGPESLDGEPVQHLRVMRFVSDSSTVMTASTIAFLATLSQTEIYLDSQSLLPVAVKFNQHPDNDAGVNIPVTITFSDYRTVNGIRAPFHIQKYIQNGLNIDLVLATVTLNSGLSAAEFQAQ
jgi:hypothetical protein